MNERQGTWADVEVGMYVRDQNSVAWRVEDKRDEQLLLVRPSAQPQILQRPAGHTAVTILEPTDSEALSLVQRELGGTVLAEKSPGKPAKCPPLTKELATIHAHMFLLHGVWTKSGPGSRSAERLLEFHREDHTDPKGPVGKGFVPHIHTSDWESR